MSAHLRQVIATRALIVLTLLAIAAVHTGRTIRHPLRYARCMGVRVVRRIPRLPRDGEPLDDLEMRDFIAICRGWKHAASTEGSRT